MPRSGKFPERGKRQRRAGAMARSWRCRENKQSFFLDEEGRGRATTGVLWEEDSSGPYAQQPGQRLLESVGFDKVARSGHALSPSGRNPTWGLLVAFRRIATAAPGLEDPMRSVVAL
ncbi:hypothetical protein MPTK1_6g18660 [Marchantia polymorpha subsp. ruderalis]|uniref:Uncharacterized protein n=2 Tax=Marchantia polymorpha TaxID=3197 RepID=A0AAF6BTI4_MARPO|nr:hypothetical protein MARPO_0038s0076 [Marchantia polymorpha]BBN15318.1 hypothetical protein Mp_6g18660 [Marchantia polymorpha subsp. ruderalis]|eukprot:PTQ40751.1 hypothetical protein MARPO_0038s0076 [Marchantia polymorpha]